MVGKLRGVRVVKAGAVSLVPSPRKAEWSGRWVRGGACAERIVPGLGREKYRIGVGEGGVVLEAGGAAGAFYARGTLGQIRRQSPEGMLREGRVEDGPALGVRGY